MIFKLNLSGLFSLLVLSNVAAAPPPTTFDMVKNFGTNAVQLLSNFHSDIMSLENFLKYLYKSPDDQEEILLLDFMQRLHEMLARKEEPSHVEEVTLVMKIVNIISSDEHDHSNSQISPYRNIIGSLQDLNPLLQKYYMLNAEYIHNVLAKERSLIGFIQNVEELIMQFDIIRNNFGSYNEDIETEDLQEPSTTSQLLGLVYSLPSFLPIIGKAQPVTSQSNTLSENDKARSQLAQVAKNVLHTETSLSGYQLRQQTLETAQKSLGPVDLRATFRNAAKKVNQLHGAVPELDILICDSIIFLFNFAASFKNKHNRHDPDVSILIDRIQPQTRRICFMNPWKTEQVEASMRSFMSAITANVYK